MPPLPVSILGNEPRKEDERRQMIMKGIIPQKYFRSYHFMSLLDVGIELVLQNNFSTALASLSMPTAMSVVQIEMVLNHFPAIWAFLWR
jgi:hypothetical protein